MMQPTLFETEPSKFDRFLEFHADHPEVYSLFRQFALEVFRTGLRRFGARLIWERLRWHVTVEIGEADSYRLNDHLLPYYSRLLMLREPHLDGVFERRDSRFDTDDETLLRETARIGGPA